MGVVWLVTMVMIMVALVTMSMIVVMVMMPVLMDIIMVVQTLAWPRAARVLVENQRFDGDGHGVGRHADAAEIDIVEIP